jgi:hypothetical protein
MDAGPGLPREAPSEYVIQVSGAGEVTVAA